MHGRNYRLFMCLYGHSVVHRVYTCIYVFYIYMYMYCKNDCMYTCTCTLYMYMCTLAEANKTIGAAEPDLTQN